MYLLNKMFEYIKTESGYKCPHCDYEKALQSTVHMHIKAKHSGAFKHKCSHCPYETSTKANLENHLANKHPEESNKMAIKEHSCPKCVYECRTAGQLRSHYILKHLTSEFEKLFVKEKENISCSGCKKEFKSRAAFVYHCVECLPDSATTFANDRIGLCLD